MAYGTIYQTEIQSFKYNNQYRLSILDRDMDADDISTPILASRSPIRLRIDDGGYVRGTSLEFSFLSETDRQYIGLFTNDQNKFLVRLEKYNSYTAIYSLKWQGYIVPFQYSEAYVAPPYPVTITATDKLGTKKEIEYTTNKTNLITELEVIQEILPIMFRPNKPFAVDLTMYPTLRDGTATLLSSYMKPWLYQEKGYTEYEVLEDILKKYEAFITQKNGRWHIQSKVTHTETYIVYNTSLVGNEVTKTSKKIGNVDNEAYPIGNLNLNITPPAKNVTITNKYNKTKSLIPGDFSNWDYYDDNDYLTKWNNPDNIATLAGGDSVSIYNDTDQKRYISYSQHVISSDIPIVVNFTALSNNVDFYIRIKINGNSTWYLSEDGSWGNNYNEIKINVADSLRGTMAYYEEFTIKGDGFPEDGTLEVAINALEFVNMNFSFFYVRLNPDGIPDENKNTYAINANASKDKQDINIYYGSISEDEKYDPWHSYNNWLKYDDGGRIKQWTWNGIGDNLINIVNEKIKALESTSRYKLTGIIETDNLFFDYLTDAFTSGKKYTLTEGIFDLQNDQIDGTLKDTAL